MHTAKQRTNAGNELAGAEGLHQIVVSAKLEADDAVFNLALRGEHDDRHIGIVANGAAHALARHTGKHEVEHDQVEMMLGKFFEGFLAVANGGHPVVLTFEIGGYSIADCLLVFDEENASRFVAHDECSPAVLISRPTRDPGVRPHAARNFRFGFIVTIQAQPWAICWQNDIISPYGPKKPNTTTFRTRRFAAQQASACPKCARNPRVARRNGTPIGTQPGDKGASPWSLGGSR